MKLVNPGISVAYSHNVVVAPSPPSVVAMA